jgi:hypothetical protein
MLHLLNSEGGPSVLQMMSLRPRFATRTVVTIVSVGVGHTIFANDIEHLVSLRRLKETLLAIGIWSKLFFLNAAILQDYLTSESSSRGRQDVLSSYEPSQGISTITKPGWTS